MTQNYVNRIRIEFLRIVTNSAQVKQPITLDQVVTLDFNMIVDISLRKTQTKYMYKPDRYYFKFLKKMNWVIGKTMRHAFMIIFTVSIKILQIIFNEANHQKKNQVINEGSKMNM